MKIFPDKFHKTAGMDNLNILCNFGNVHGGLIMIIDYVSACVSLLLESMLNQWTILNYKRNS